MYLRVFLLAFIVVICSASEPTLLVLSGSSYSSLGASLIIDFSKNCRDHSIEYVYDEAPNIGHMKWDRKTSTQFASSEIPSDGWHPIINPRYSEIWYFDFQARTGEMIVSSFTVYGNLYKNATVRVYLSIYRKNEQALHFTILRPISELYASLDSLNVSVGRSFALAEGSSIKIYMSNGTVSCYLKYSPESLPWVNQKRGFYSTWFVPVPRANVVGWYNISGEQRKVSGVGYHDHAWDITPKFYTETEGIFLGYPFVWGRVHTKNVTVLFSQAPTLFQVACVFFDSGIIEFSRIRFYERDDHFLVSALSGNDLLLMEIKVDYSDQLFVTERMESYRYLFSASGVFVLRGRSTFFAGRGIMNLQSIIRSNETDFGASLEADEGNV